MGRPVNIPPEIGTVFEYLTIVGNFRTISKNGINIAHIDAVCRCGKTITVTVTSIVHGRKKSCGCLVSDLAKQRQTKTGLSQTKEYRTWYGILKRCYDKNYKHYYRYGGRGIEVCEKWRISFLDFLSDVGVCPEGMDSLDRFPNNDGHYEPGNVRWATALQQANNRTSNLVFKLNGEEKTLKQWSILYEANYGMVWSRVNKGIEIMKALTDPPDQKQRNNSLKKSKL